MKNVITALNSPILNDKMKEEQEINVVAKDILYQEGIFELIEKNNNIDYLIISEILTGQYEFKKLIEKIRQENNLIKIIVILENMNSELENYLYAKGVFKIFYNNKVEIKEIIDIINNDYTENEKIIKELEDLKNILIQNNIQIKTGEDIINSKNNNIMEINKKNYKKILDNIKLRKVNKKEIIDKKIISILGTGGVGKSVVTINISNILKENNYKILIIDFDVLNNSLHTLLGVEKYPEKIKEKIKNNYLIKNKIDIKELAIKINNKIDLIAGVNLLFDSKYKISSLQIKNILNELKENYDYIIIDTTAECFFDYTRNIIVNSDLNIFLVECNVTEIKKAKRLLEIYNKEWNIEKREISIVLNKYNKYSIKDKTMKNIFSDYEILGKINFNKKYNNLINKSYKKNVVIKKRIKREYEKMLVKKDK